MQRIEIQQLKKWKQSNGRKPMIIRGARQVGKTWLMKEFGRLEYKDVVYVNCEADPAVRNMFTGDFDTTRIIRGLQIIAGKPIEPNHTLIIIDEIQEAPGALTSLKYFQENAPEYHVIAAGSLLGITLNRSGSFPVGKVEFLDLFPLSFVEFLDAIHETQLADLLRNPDWSLVASFSIKFTDRLRQYYYTGGMPEVVLQYSVSGDMNQVREIQKRILVSYEQDFSKHAPAEIVPRIRMIWSGVPAQLAKENRKFIYGQIKAGARAKDFELALSWLIDCGLLYKVHNVSKPALPLKAYEELNTFKLFMLDIGLLGALTELDARTLLEGNTVFTEFKGALTEQYVYQQLRTMNDLPVYYWSAGNARSEVDFLLQHNGQIIPLEVKAEENLHAKSLRVFCEKYKPALAVRSSMSGYRKEDWMTNLPLYAVSTITQLQ
ncbi:MAG TPA: ATP-binding protein [Chitinophagaceae bacterium]|jgi:predicted AAA+ superfamily ATPase|nr:ATP-binding protein [Chitinophagaceae bacterium]HPN60473.1 ATP-binding protein [Chitinophagaceae bacterium]